MGALTETEPPPAGSAELDRLWWLLDGAEKSLRRKIKLRGSAPKLVDDFAACDQTLADEMGASLGPKRSAAALHADARTRRNTNRRNNRIHSGTPGKSSILDESEGKKQQPQAGGSVPQQAIADADDRLVKMRREYEGLMRPRVKTAGIPIVRWQEGHESPLALAKRMSRRIARSAYYRVFGRWPHVTMLDPRWAAAQPLLRALETAKAKGARDALVVSGPTGLLNISGFDGKIARMTYDGFMSGLRFWWANHAAAAVKDDGTSTIAYAAGVTIDLQVPIGAATEFSSQKRPV